VLWGLTWPVGNFPLNDDWVYALGARSIVETGHFTLPSPTASNVVAQAYWGALFCLPFGFSFNALRVSTGVLGALGLFAQYQLVRELGAGRRVALVAGLSLAVNPFYLDLSTGFMTDVPFAAISAASLWLYVRAVRRGSAAAFVGAVLLAGAAILIRQFGLVLPLAFAAAHLARRGVSLRTLAVAVLPLALGVGLHVGYRHWLAAAGRTPLLAGDVAVLVPQHLLTSLHMGAQRAAIALTYLGLCLAPFVLYLASTRQPGRPGDGLRPLHAWGLVTLLTVLLMAALIDLGFVLPGLGNVLAPFGIGPLTLRDTAQFRLNLPVVPPAVAIAWQGLTVLGAAVGMFAALAAARALLRVARGILTGRDRQETWPAMLLLVTSGAYAAGILLVGVQYGTFFDRYLLYLIVPLAALLAIRRAPPGPVQDRPWRAALCVGVLGAYAAFSVLGTHDYLAWNRARWQATASLLASGVKPNAIEGGYEFDGWNLYATPVYLDHLQPSNWYYDDDEYVIASGPLGGYTEVRRVAFIKWLGLHEASVLILLRIVPAGF